MIFIKDEKTGRWTVKELDKVTPENVVTSLDTSRALKMAGFRQDTFFFWACLIEKKEECRLIIVEDILAELERGKFEVNLYAAFTPEELAERFLDLLELINKFHVPVRASGGCPVS